MGRISRAQMFMQMAKVASLRSTCHRLNVGAIVTRENNPIAVGWNGQESGMPHCAGNSCPGIVPGQCDTIHAEVNALNKAQVLLLGRSWKPVDLYCTNSPCPGCVAYILRRREAQQAGITVGRIFYEVPYRDVSHLGQLHGLVEVYNVTPAGYIVDHFTRQVVEMP